MVTLLLVFVLIGLSFFVLSMFFEKKRTIILVMVIIAIGIVMVVEQLKYTTFVELYYDQLNEHTDVKKVTITINEGSGSMRERIRRLIIDEDETIESIVEDFSDLELKRDEDIQLLQRDYQIELVVKNQVEKNQFRTTSIRLDVDEGYVNEYKIRNQSNHLSTIKSLAADDSLDWERFE